MQGSQHAEFVGCVKIMMLYLTGNGKALILLSKEEVESILFY